MTFSRLTLGEPRLKSKLRGGSVSKAEPCEDPTVGFSISEDWETYEADSGISYLAFINSGNDFIQDKDGNQLEEWPYFTNQRTRPFDGVIGDGHWQTSSANPQVGSTHVRSVAVQTTYIYATNVRSCAEAYWTGRVSEGAILDVSVWFSMDTIPSGWEHTFEIRAAVYDEEHQLCFAQETLQTVSDITSAGYNQYTLSTSIPPTQFSVGPPYWVIVLFRQIRTNGSGFVAINNDLDDVSITVTK